MSRERLSIDEFYRLARHIEEQSIVCELNVDLLAKMVNRKISRDNIGRYSVTAVLVFRTFLEHTINTLFAITSDGQGASLKRMDEEIKHLNGVGSLVEREAIKARFQIAEILNSKDLSIWRNNHTAHHNVELAVGGEIRKKGEVILFSKINEQSLRTVLFKIRECVKVSLLSIPSDQFDQLDKGGFSSDFKTPLMSDFSMIKKDNQDAVKMILHFVGSSVKGGRVSVLFRRFSSLFKKSCNSN